MNRLLGTILNKETDRLYQSEQNCAVVFPITHAVGSAAVRSLARANIPIIGLAQSATDSLYYSRYCNAVYCSDIRRDEEGFLRTLIELGRKFKVKPVLFLVDDPEIISALRHRTELEQYYYLPSAPWGTIKNIIDKGKLYRFCQNHDLPIPRTWTVNSDAELERVKDELIFPCLIKPTLSDEFKKYFGYKAKSFTEFTPLQEMFQTTQRLGLEVVIQEEISGSANQLYTYGCYADKDANIIASFTGRKLRQFPPVFGTCRLGESINDAELAELGAKFIKAVNYSGIAQVEFKKDPSGQLRLIEINCRCWKWDYLATVCGANLYFAAYRDVLGLPPLPITMTRPGIKWTSLLDDLYFCLRGYSFYGYPTHAVSFGQWLASIRGEKVEAFIDFSDPLPGLVRNIALICELYTYENDYRRRHEA